MCGFSGNLKKNKMQIYFAKLLGNYFLYELVDYARNEDLFLEIGSVINENTLEFTICTPTKHNETILSLAKQTFETKHYNIYHILQKMYFTEWKINFTNKRFSQNEIKTFTFHYFIPTKSENRYIFKYFPVNKYLKETIKKNSLWFNSPQNFRDVTDCKFEIDTEPSKKNILNFYYKKHIESIIKEENQPTIDDFERQFVYPTIEKFNSDLLDHYFNVSFSMLGICCFSEKHDNKVMWDQYANGYKGVCLVFDTTLSSDKYYNFKGLKVRYFKKLPKYFYEGSGRMEVGHIIFSKTADYKFENEIREHVNFQLEEIIERNIEFNPISLKAIILGPKCSDESKKTIQQLISKNKYQNIELIESKIDNKLNIKLNRHTTNLKEKKPLSPSFPKPL